MVADVRDRSAVAWHDASALPTAVRATGYDASLCCDQTVALRPLDPIARSDAGSGSGPAGD
ncbi:hypothetical protein CFP66_36665 [Pseudonocardia sp. MH-G8]|nr:hypothetical protein CFP66_36665 [Pseudonocardia sp. MH-G8]